MQEIGYYKGNTVEKIIRDKQGRLIRATFYVYENAGRLKARLVDFVYLSDKVLRNTVFALSGFAKTKFSPRCHLGEMAIISPYFAFDILYSSGSKPRAPSFS